MNLAMDCPRAEEQVLRDLRVGQALADQDEDFALASAQRGRDDRWGDCWTDRGRVIRFRTATASATASAQPISPHFLASENASSLSAARVAVSTCVAAISPQTRRIPVAAWAAATAPSQRAARSGWFVASATRIKSSIDLMTTRGSPLGCMAAMASV